MGNVVSITTGNPVVEAEVQELKPREIPPHLIDAALTALEKRLGIRL